MSGAVAVLSPAESRGPAPTLGAAELIAVLDREGGALRAAAARAGLEAAVPSCPEWRVRDLLRHLGGVHRWAATHVAEQRATAMGGSESEALMAGWPADPTLLDWFSSGHRELVRVLLQAPPDLDCWTFLPASSPLLFWARRQAHETGIHRADVEAAMGAIKPFEIPVAVDGIEEMLFGFAARPRRLALEESRRLRLCASDCAHEWLVRMGPSGVEASRQEGAGDCLVRDSASALFLLLWNRQLADGSEVEGDRTLLQVWRDSVRVRWA